MEILIFFNFFSWSNELTKRPLSFSVPISTASPVPLISNVPSISLNLIVSHFTCTCFTPGLGVSLAMRSCFRKLSASGIPSGVLLSGFCVNLSSVKYFDGPTRTARSQHSILVKFDCDREFSFLLLPQQELWSSLHRSTSHCQKS